MRLAEEEESPELRLPPIHTLVAGLEAEGLEFWPEEPAKAPPTYMEAF